MLSLENERNISRYEQNMPTFHIWLNKNPSTLSGGLDSIPKTTFLVSKQIFPQKT